MIYYYHTRTVKRLGEIEFVNQANLFNRQGFRSVYGFSSYVADEIKKQGSFRDISHMPVIAQDLLLDFDNNKEAADTAMQWLYRNRYIFDKYNSGNRSIHFHIATTLLEGADVPHSHLKFVREHFKGADDSIYRHSGLFRLANTYHEKAGGGTKKVFVGSYGSRLLEIPYVERNLGIVPRAQDRDSARWKFQSGLSRPKGQGGRRMYAGWLAMMAFDAGVDINEAVDQIVSWAQEYAQPPYEPLEEVVAKVWEIYDTRTRGGK